MAKIYIYARQNGTFCFQILLIYYAKNILENFVNEMKLKRFASRKNFQKNDHIAAADYSSSRD